MRLAGPVEHLARRDLLFIDIENIIGVEGVEIGKVVPKDLFSRSTSEKGG